MPAKRKVIKNPFKSLATEEATPFIPVGNNGKRKVVKFERYPHISILNSSKLCRMLLGKRLFWTIKEDGECVTIWLKKHTAASKSTNVILMLQGKNYVKYDIIISSRNQEIASQDIQNRVRETDEYSKIVYMLSDNPMFRIVCEECRKGRSVTGIKTYNRDQLFMIDIYDTAQDNYLAYTAMYQQCYHYGIQTVKLYAETRHRTIKDLLKFKNHVLEYCDSQCEGKEKEEGMVCTTFDDEGQLLKAKVKLDIPEPKVRKIREGQVILPQIPESEIMGAISKVEADFGLTGQPKDDMPRIAAEVSKACKEHLYSSRGNLFQYYKIYLERMIKK